MKLFRGFFVFVFFLSLSLAAHAQLLSYTLKREDAYIIGIRIAESIALGLLTNIAEVDDKFLYDAYAAKGTLTIYDDVYPTVDITIKIEEDMDIKEITFSLALASQQAEDGNYYIIGRVMNAMANGKANQSVTRLNGTMYAETEDNVVPVKLVNGLIEIIN